MSRAARPEVLDEDGVVAVVGTRVITLVELKARAEPFLRGPDRSAMLKAELYAALLDKMIDELLLETEGVRAGIVVTPEEVDTGIKAIAGLTMITSAEVIEGAERRGITEKAYREEIRRQVLEGKLMRAQFPHLAAYPYCSRSR
jgi:peptidyl-prolyl cis-trans isomerase SurA